MKNKFYIFKSIGRVVKNVKCFQDFREYSLLMRTTNEDKMLKAIKHFKRIYPNRVYCIYANSKKEALRILDRDGRYISSV